MEASLKNRLTYGPIMFVGLIAIVAFDYYSEQWTKSARFPHGIKGIGIALFLMVLLPSATLELARMFSAKHATPYRFISGAGIFLLLLHAWLTQFPQFTPYAASSLAFVVVFSLLFAALRLAVTKQIEGAIPVMAGTLLATLYLGGQGWFLMALRVKTGVTATGGSFTGTTMTVVMILLTVKFTDVGAYFGGRAFGRHKLIPWLSPGKTWEGLFFGVLTAAGVGAAFSPSMANLSWEKGLLFGLVIGGVGQLGDLLESMMKRDAQVKDSGKLIPGFGGIMDVIDSPLLAAPFAYLLFSLI